MSGQYVKWKNPSQVIEVLRKIGVRATYTPVYRELIIRGKMHDVVLSTFGGITIYQNNIEISYSEFKKSLRIINEDTGEVLYIYFPKKSEAGYYKDHLWVVVA
jgi:hypothetical protein